MIVTTMNDIPGYEVDEVFGEVMGLTVRSRNIGSQLGSGLKSILGGELKGLTKALIDSRLQVRERMVEEAEALGANAIIAMRFDTSEMGGNWRSAPTARRCACARRDLNGHVSVPGTRPCPERRCRRLATRPVRADVRSGHGPVPGTWTRRRGTRLSEIAEQREELLRRADDDVRGVQ
jgi:uncharacterized protein YbjQ (UPF0145 family)